MEFEDLTHIDLARISRKYPAKWTVADMRSFSAEIANEYDLLIDDATTAFLVASECKAEYEQIHHTYERRVSQLTEKRKNDNAKIK